MVMTVSATLIVFQGHCGVGTEACALPDLFLSSRVQTVRYTLVQERDNCHERHVWLKQSLFAHHKHKFKIKKRRRSLE